MRDYQRDRMTYREERVPPCAKIASHAGAMTAFEVGVESPRQLKMPISEGYIDTCYLNCMLDISFDFIGTVAACARLKPPGLSGVLPCRHELLRMIVSMPMK